MLNELLRQCMHLWWKPHQEDMQLANSCKLASLKQAKMIYSLLFEKLRTADLFPKSKKNNLIYNNQWFWQLITEKLNSTRSITSQINGTDMVTLYKKWGIFEKKARITKPFSNLGKANCSKALLNLAEMNVGLSVFFALTNYFHLDASSSTNF